jgi:hypothetical protein
MRNKFVISIFLFLLTMLFITPGFSCNYTNTSGEAVNTSNQQANTGTEVNQPGNNPPVIDNIISEWTSVERGKTTKIKIIAHDPDGDKLTYSWRCMRGSISGKGTEVTYSAPTGYVDDNPITVYVSDGRGGGEISSVNIPVVCCSHAQKNPDWSP